jgi:hypothetical protein
MLEEKENRLLRQRNQASAVRYSDSE